MMPFAKNLARAAALWMVLVFGQVVGGLLLFRHAPAFPADGPLGAGQAMLAVCAIDAVILALLAGRMRARGLVLGLILAGLLFGVQTFLSLIEAVVFGHDLRLSSATLALGAVASLLRALLAGAAIAGLWRRRSEESPGKDGAQALRLGGPAWKLPAVAALYVACYFVAGAAIAWRSEAVRAFYAHIHQIDLTALAAVQLGRGLLWGGFAWLLARELARPAWRTALLTGLSFAGLMAPQLLYPNPAMPWPVRAAHMVELGLSNLVFGALAALILLAGTRNAGSPAVHSS